MGRCGQEIVARRQAAAHEAIGQHAGESLDVPIDAGKDRR